MEEEAEAKEGEICVKVMTEEQIEVLRRQISAYATICEQLVEMHRVTTSQQDSLPGMRMTGLFSDHFTASGAAKMSARQRWTPTPVQLQILESIFYQGNGTPSKQKIKEITSELSQHGKISETNVYNWFQNRRARSKRKQSIPAAPNNTESEAEADSLSEKKAKTDKLAPRCGQLLSPALDDHPFQDVSSELRFVDPDPSGGHGVYLLHSSSKLSGGSGEVSAYGDSLQIPILNGLIGRMEAQRGFSSFQSAHQDHAGNRRVY